MGYYVRAFCTNPKPPSLASILKRLEQNGRLIQPSQEFAKTDLETQTWEHFAFLYKDSKLPILVECNQDDGTPNSLLRKEIGEFIEFIGSPLFSVSKREVINHLKKNALHNRMPTDNK